MTTQPPAFSVLIREVPHIAQLWAGRWRRVSKNLAPPNVTAERQPILVIPGLLSRDYSTSLLRRSLKHAGYPTYNSKLGFMRGVTLSRMARAEKRLAEIANRHGEKVVLIGWSLGGLYARVLAQRCPDLAKMVMTLGTPFSGNRRANNAWRIYEAINDHSVDNPPISDDVSVKPPIRTVAVWSSWDGVIPPDCARGQDHERDVAIEVESRHLTFGCGRRAIDQIIPIVGEQLAQV